MVFGLLLLAGFPEVKEGEGEGGRREWQGGMNNYTLQGIFEVEILLVTIQAWSFT